MEGTQSSPNWAEVEHRLGLKDPALFAQRELVPIFEAIPEDLSQRDKDWAKSLQAPMTMGFFSFAGLFILLNIILPDTFIGVALRLIAFFPLFLACMAGAVYFYRNRLMGIFAQGQERFIARSRALTRLANELGLTYVPSPGGAPAALNWIAKQSFAPVGVKEAAAVLDDHGGMDKPLAVARRSGMMLADVVVLGDKKHIDKYKANAVSHVRVEDGFQGAASGLPYSAFEWVQPVQDEDDIHHLSVVFELPNQLHGITQLRSRHISWPGKMEDVSFNAVGVVAPAFEDRFRMRSTDQVEARTIFDPAVLERVADLAHGEKVRAIAYERHLIVDVEGEDRFAMMDLVTGEWNTTRIAKSMINIAEMRDLAEAVGDAFRL
ncbi:MAG: DUF3137 domain-containing protein [Pseudomonadota bacterium]